jgi:hypothetical protein
MLASVLDADVFTACFVCGGREGGGRDAVRGRAQPGTLDRVLDAQCYRLLVIFMVGVGEREGGESIPRREESKKACKGVCTKEAGWVS